MWRLSFISIILGSFSLIISNAYAQQAQTQTIRQVTITTTAPEPKNVVVIPEGYINCTTVGAGWNQNVWVPEHRVCQYPSNNPAFQGVAWVDSYWGCTQFTNDGNCTNWEWKEGHWVKTGAELY